jgi:cytochrome bd-type quinol oxidase subunit 2
MKKSNLFRLVVHFFTLLIVGLILVFIIHTSLLEVYQKPRNINNIQLAYVVNGLLAVVIFLTLFLLRKKYRDQLGFLFMAGSFLKFGVFFVFFYPNYVSDNDITKLEFLAFFTPYVYSLFVETLALIKLLNLPQEY